MCWTSKGAAQQLAQLGQQLAKAALTGHQLCAPAQCSTVLTPPITLDAAVREIGSWLAGALFITWLTHCGVRCCWVLAGTFWLEQAI